MNDHALERLLLEAQTELLPSRPSNLSWMPVTTAGPVVDSICRELEALAWIDDQMSGIEDMARRFDLVELLPQLAHARSEIAREVVRRATSCRPREPAQRETTIGRVLLFPVLVGAVKK